VLSQHSFESRAWGKRDEGREGPRAQLIAEHHSYPARWGSVCSMAFVSALLVGGVSAALLQGASPIGCWRGCRLSLMMWWGRNMRPATIAGHRRLSLASCLASGTLRSGSALGFAWRCGVRTDKESGESTLIIVPSSCLMCMM